MNKFYKIYNKITDVSITNLKYPVLSQFDKINITNKLIYSNIRNVQIGSTYVNDNKILDNLDLFDGIRSIRPSNLSYIVPTLKKYNEIKNYDKLSKLCLITSCSELYLRINKNKSLDESIIEMNKIINLTNLQCRIYILSAFGCIYEGSTNFSHHENINRIFTHFSDNPKVTEIVLVDTRGTSTINQIDKYMIMFGSSNKVGLHIHNNNDKNIYSIVNSHIEKLTSIDSSLGNINKSNTLLSTYKLATIINQITNTNIYDLKHLLDLENDFIYKVNKK